MPQRGPSEQAPPSPAATEVAAADSDNESSSNETRCQSPTSPASTTTMLEADSNIDFEDPGMGAPPAAALPTPVFGGGSTGVSLTAEPHVGVAMDAQAEGARADTRRSSSTKGLPRPPPEGFRSWRHYDKIVRHKTKKKGGKKFKEKQKEKQNNNRSKQK